MSIETETTKAKPYCIYCKSEDVALYPEEFEELMQIGCHDCQLEYYVDKDDFLARFTHKHDWQYDAEQGDVALYICSICDASALREVLPEEGWCQHFKKHFLMVVSMAGHGGSYVLHVILSARAVESQNVSIKTDITTSKVVTR